MLREMLGLGARRRGQAWLLTAAMLLSAAALRPSLLPGARTVSDMAACCAAMRNHCPAGRDGGESDCCLHWVSVPQPAALLLGTVAPAAAAAPAEPVPAALLLPEPDGVNSLVAPVPHPPPRFTTVLLI